MQRNVLIDYAKESAREGTNIYARMEGRIISQ
jgi:hypothetical protein